MEDKTFNDVYEEIRDRENFIAKKLLGKYQHAVYLDKGFYQQILKMSKEDGRSFNQQLIFLARQGLVHLGKA